MGAFDVHPVVGFKIISCYTDTSLWSVYVVRRWLLPLRVQRLRLPETELRSFTVVDGCGVPVWPVEEFLAHLVAGGKAPNTVEGYAYDLRDLFEWLGQRAGTSGS